MLVLSRAVGEIISIGDDIAVHILEVNGNQVKFGVQAPPGGKRTPRRDLPENPPAPGRRHPSGARAQPLNNPLSRTDAWARHA